MKMLLSSVILALLLSACNPQEPVAPANDSSPAPAAAAESAAGTAPLTIVNWGQRTTPAGVPFNVQADGHSGVSFELSRKAPPADVAISFDGKPLTGVVVGGVIVTATIPPAYLAEVGSYPVVMELLPAGTRIEAGNFEVVKP
ncbi:MAG: hypothetical protein M3R16_01275 [Pseudomonadota bacterium]|nr:hypothetical protein [Pseudomonadota bacterium]